MNDFHAFINRTRNRRWRQTIFHYSLCGLILGSGIAILIGVVGLIYPMHFTVTWMISGLGGGWLVGLLLGAVRRPSEKDTAFQIDQAANLKDRMQSALQFATEDEFNSYHALQIIDANRALRSHRVCALFPWRWPRQGTWASLSFSLALFLTCWMPHPRPVKASAPKTPQAVITESKELGEDLKRFEEMAEELDSEEMKKLAGQLRQSLEKFREESHSVEDAMVHLAKMTTAVESAAEAYDPLLLQQALKQLGEGMKSLDGFKAASELLKQGDYAKAGYTLAKFGQRIGSFEQPLPSSGGLTQIRIGQLADQARKAGLADLSGALKELETAIRTGSRKQCEAALRKIGRIMKRYGKRSQIGRRIRAQLANLGRCKQCLSKSGGYCMGCLKGGKCQDGNCKGKGVSSGQQQLAYKRSDSPSQSAGTTNSTNLYDRPTDLNSGKSEKNLTGMMGHGPSETEVEITHEGTQRALRTYRQVYAKYSKLSHEVMIEEAIPLGHRKIIKHYFELIHPDRIEPEEMLREPDIGSLDDTSANTDQQEDNT